MSDAISERAKRLASSLRDVANEFANHMPKRHAEANKMDAATCRDSADMLRKLDTEVFRLRQAIGCYLHGRIGMSELRNIAETWNEGPAS